MIQGDALNELQNAARNFADEYAKAPAQSGFTQWSDACERLEAAAIAYAKERAPKFNNAQTLEIVRLRSALETIRIHVDRAMPEKK